MMEQLPVSIVVPCYARPDFTRDLLHSLQHACVQGEIVVVDDASPEPLESIVSEFEDLDVTYLRLPENRGAAFARNFGVARSRHDYVAFTDNDCVVDASWLQHLYGAIRRTPAAMAGIGGRVVAAGTDIYSRYFDYHKILDPWYFRGKNYYVTTANCIFKRHAFDLVGGFDEAVPGAGGEDPGLCFKLQNVGYNLGYNPDAVVFHRYSPTLTGFMRTFYRYWRGCAGQSAKHFRSQAFVENPTFGALELGDDH